MDKESKKEETTRVQKLNLGCGEDIRRGYINIDKDSCEEDVYKHNLEKGIPFKANTVSHIIAKDVLEHIKNLEKLIDEIYRVCIDEAHIFVQVPYYRSDNAFAFEHKHFSRKKTIEKLFPPPRFHIIKILFQYTYRIARILSRFPLGLFDNLKGNIQAIIEVRK